MTRIFINYRRRKSSGAVGRLYRSLTGHFGEDQLVLDVALAPGTNFVNAVNDVVGSCGVLIAVIGPDWAGTRDARGELPLESRDDFVRLEIKAALTQPGVRLVPALVDGASMPTRSELPDALAGLAEARAVALRDPQWEHDMARLIAMLEEVPA